LVLSKEKMRVFTTQQGIARRALILALAVVSFLAVAFVPCGGEICCMARAADVTVHAQMPCCTPQLSPQDAPRPEAVTTTPTAVIAQSATVVATVTPAIEAGSLPLISRTHQTSSRALLEPAEPLFLLNAQFLI
jgi:hypothetical protein